MPYIGNNHIAGDHTNNFKVLDDISSFTATFDGSATSVVDTTNNTIRVVEHRFIQGQRVTYTNGSGGNIGGLTTGTAYFVIFDSASTIKLATNASNAANNIAINLSSVGTGSSHTLNAAFDGVNKKFKLTHGSGTGARLNNATQINVAINNVLQRPNLDPNNFTDGFALEDNHKIVFQTAPSSEDIFWGSIIANTLTTFDISDHKIDTFTGDGSTTEFNLSHTPANNESLMVTINGVLQHPSNASTTRAYTLIANVIQFTAAPDIGDEIQVRHIGFAGATTADVSGFYGRTGNVVLTDQDDVIVNKISVGTGATIESNGQATFTGIVTFGSSSTTINNNVVNVGTALTLGHTQGVQFHTQNLHSAGFEVNQINSSGIITASSLDVSGNAFIGGVLTYEDVTSIDAVGLITARNGIDCNGDLDVDGHTNLDNVSIAGVSTFASNVIVNGGISNAQYLNLSALAPSIDFNDTNHNSDFMLQNANGLFKLYDNTNTADRVTVASNGNVSVKKDLDVDGHTNLDNVSIAGVTTFSGDIRTHNIFPLGNNRDIGSVSNPFRDIHLSNDLSLIDSGLLKLGDNNELLIQHTGSNNYIEGGSGFSGNLHLRAKLNQEGVKIVSNGAVTLHHSGTARLTTSSGGVGVTGDITVSGSVDGVDIAALNTTVGTKLANIVEDTSPQLGADLQSNGHHIRMDNTKYVWLGTDGFGIAGYSSNQVYFEGNSTGQTLYIRPKLNQNSIKAVPNGSVALHYSGGLKLETASNGVTVTGTLAATALTGDGSGITGITQTTINSNTDHYLITGTGTANTLQGESSLQWNGTSLTLNKSANAYLNPDINIYNSYNGGWAGGISFSGKYSGTKETQARIRVYGGNDGNDASLAFETGTPTEALRIDSSQRVMIGSGTYSASNISGYKVSIKESSNENAAIMFLDTDNMKGGICGATKGNNQLVTGTGNMDFVVGSLYSDTFIISGQSGNQDGAIRMKVEGTSGRVLIAPSAASEQGPAGNLDIVGDTNSNGPELYLRVSNNNTTDNIGALLFGNNVDKSICMIRGATHTANNTGDIQFHTSNSGTMSEVFKIDNAGQFTAQSESPALYGYYTSLNNQNHYIDFPQWTRDSFICLEIFGNVNPNSAGSGAYLDPVHMYVYRGIGWTGSRLGYYIYSVSVAPPARHVFPSGTGYSGNAQISAVWTDGSSNLGNETATTTNYMRLLVPNGNNTYAFQKQFRIFRRR